MWEDLIQKAKDGGLDVIDTYVFWNVHEPSPGNVLFWNLDLVLINFQYSLKFYIFFFYSFHLHFFNDVLCCSTILKEGTI